MNKNFQININSLSSKFVRYAKREDFRGDNNGVLSGNEISLFIEACKKDKIDVTNESWFKDIERENKFAFNFNSEKYVCENDATRVDIPLYANAVKKATTEPVTVKNESAEKKPKPYSSNLEIRSNYEWSVEEFEKIIDNMLSHEKYGKKFDKSVFHGKAKAFIEAGREYMIDPRIILAVAMHESARGTSKMAIEKNNIGGLRQNGDYIKFDSIETSIKSVARTLESRYLEGYKTLNDVANSGRYCEKSVSTEWLNLVNTYIKKFNEEYPY